MQLFRHLERALRRDAGGGVVRVRVGGVGDGGPASARAKLVRAPQSLAARGAAAAAAPLHAAYRRVAGDTFSFAVIRTRDAVFVVVRREDAAHGWGQDLVVQFTATRPDPNAGSWMRTCDVDPVVDVDSGTISVGSSEQDAARKIVEVAGERAKTLGSAAFIYVRIQGWFEVRYVGAQDGDEDMGQGAEASSSSAGRAFVFAVKSALGLPWRDEDLKLEYIASPVVLKLDETRHWQLVEKTTHGQLNEDGDVVQNGFFPWHAPMDESTQKFIISAWANPARALPHEVDSLRNLCAVQRAWLAHNPLQSAIERVEAVASSFPASSRSRDFSRNTDFAMQRMRKDLGWRYGVFGKAVGIFAELADDMQLQEMSRMIHRSSEMCLARRLQCFTDVLTAAGNLLDQRDAAAKGSGSPAGNIDDENEDAIAHFVRELRAKVLEKICELKILAFRRIFIVPAEKYYFYTYNSLHDDVEVHGSNVYRAILLALLGTIVDCEPTLEDGCKAAPNFFACGWFRPLVERYWGHEAGFRWPGYVDEIYPQAELFATGPTSFHAGNDMLEPGAEALRAEAMPYLMQFVSELSWEALALPLVNLILQNGELAGYVMRICEVDNLNAFFYKVDEDDPTDVTLHQENIEALFVDRLEVLHR